MLPMQQKNMKSVERFTSLESSSCALVKDGLVLFMFCEVGVVVE